MISSEAWLLGLGFGLVGVLGGVDRHGNEQDFGVVGGELGFELLLGHRVGAAFAVDRVEDHRLLDHVLLREDERLPGHAVGGVGLLQTEAGPVLLGGLFDRGPVELAHGKAHLAELLLDRDVFVKALFGLLGDLLGDGDAVHLLLERGP